MSKKKIWSKTNTRKSKSFIKKCVLCGGLFISRSKRRRFCCPHHRIVWCEYQHLLRMKEANRLRDWEWGLLERLERFIEKERAANSEVIKNLQGHDAPQADGGETQ